MALVNCRECGREVSSSARRCPSCGKKWPDPLNDQIIKAFWIVVLVLVIFSFFKTSKEIKPQAPPPEVLGPASMAAVSAAPPSTPKQKEVLLQIFVRGKVIRIGDTFDDVLTILKESDMVRQEVSSDRNGSMLLWKHYEIGQKIFTLTVARVDNTGPYRIIRIKEGS